MLIDITCLFVDSSKNPRIDSREGLRDLVGKLVIKNHCELDNIGVAWVILRLAS